MYEAEGNADKKMILCIICTSMHKYDEDALF